MAKKPMMSEGIEFEPDAWARFERAVKTVAKSPPQHRVAKKQTTAKQQRVMKAKKKPGK